MKCPICGNKGAFKKRNINEVFIIKKNELIIKKCSSCKEKNKKINKGIYAYLPRDIKRYYKLIDGIKRLYLYQRMS